MSFAEFTQITNQNAVPANTVINMTPVAPFPVGPSITFVGGNIILAPGFYDAGFHNTSDPQTDTQDSGMKLRLNGVDIEGSVITFQDSGDLPGTVAFPVAGRVVFQVTLPDSTLTLTSLGASQNVVNASLTVIQIG
ncbi:hypothetical protein FC694_28835 [Bacillus wiedmannii]|uniref:Exosporium leader peptide n=1 Tax=Bacillus wiedmannii TaxID=1890302 RepID=A0A4U2MD92_9BACI|nr:hypothetical protein FC694_28835 [Bacillus wiedmannii]